MLAQQVLDTPSLLLGPSLDFILIQGKHSHGHAHSHARAPTPNYAMAVNVRVWELGWSRPTSLLRHIDTKNAESWGVPVCNGGCILWRSAGCPTGRVSALWYRMIFRHDNDDRAAPGSNIKPDKTLWQPGWVWSRPHCCCRHLSSWVGRQKWGSYVLLYTMKPSKKISCSHEMFFPKERNLKRRLFSSRLEPTLNGEEDRVRMPATLEVNLGSITLSKRNQIQRPHIIWPRSRDTSVR